MRTLLAAAAVLAAGTAAARPQDDARKLDGTWEVKAGTIGGKGDAKVKDVTAVVFKDGVMSVRTATGADEARFTLDSTKMPAEINLTTARGNLSVAGIYRFELTEGGPELVVAFTQGDGGPRPKDFSGDGEKTVLLRLVRKKSVRD